MVACNWDSVSQFESYVVLYIFPISPINKCYVQETTTLLFISNGDTNSFDFLIWAIFLPTIPPSTGESKLAVVQLLLLLFISNCCNYVIIITVSIMLLNYHNYM